MENKYQKLIRLIEENNLTIEKKECYDSQSGWTGHNYYVKDNNYFIISDLSGNGYCFNDSQIDNTTKEIEKYLDEKNMDTFEKFAAWVDKHSIRG